MAEGDSENNPGRLRRFKGTVGRQVIRHVDNAKKAATVDNVKNTGSKIKNAGTTIINAPASMNKSSGRFGKILMGFLIFLLVFYTWDGLESFWTVLGLLLLMVFVLSKAKSIYDWFVVGAFLLYLFDYKLGFDYGSAELIGMHWIFLLVFAALFWIFEDKGNIKGFGKRLMVFLIIGFVDMSIFPVLRQIDVLASNEMAMFALNRMLFPVILWTAIFYGQKAPNAKSDISRYAAIFIVLFYFIGSADAIVAAVQVPTDPYELTGQDRQTAQERWNEFTERISESAETIANPKKLIDFFFPDATPDEYEADVKDPDPVGVYISDVSLTKKEFYSANEEYAADPIVPWITVKSEKLATTAKNVKGYCNSGTVEGISDDAFDMTTTQQRVIRCEFPQDTDETQFNTGKRSITAGISYEFETEADLRLYFISEDLLVSMTNDQYFSDKKSLLAGLERKDPVAENPNSPVIIAMGAVLEQPVAIPEDSAIESIFGVNIINYWKDSQKYGEGIVEKITGLTLIPPEYMSVTRCDYSFAKSTENGRTVYKLVDEINEEIDEERIFICNVRVDDMENFFDGDPIAMRTFTVRVEYVYSLEKAVEVKIKRRPVSELYDGVDVQ